MSSDTLNVTGTQAAILSAAEALFSQFGYVKVTMEEIAAEAGFKKPSLYYYYSTKEELFRAVVEKKRTGFRENVQQVFDENGPAEEQLTQYVLIRFEYFKNLQELNILDFKHATRNAPALVEMFRRHTAEELEWVTRLLESGNKAGVFFVQTPHEVAELFLHALRGLRLRVIRQSESLRPTAEAMSKLEEEIKLFTKIFLAGISNRRKQEN